MLAAVLLVPVLRRLFEVAALSGQQLLTVAGLACLPTLIIQAERMIKEGMRK